MMASQPIQQNFEASIEFLFTCDGASVTYHSPLTTSVSDPEAIRSVDPDTDSESGSESRRAKNYLIEIDTLE